MTTSALDAAYDRFVDDLGDWAHAATKREAFEAGYREAIRQVRRALEDWDEPGWDQAPDSLWETLDRFDDGRGCE